VADSDSIVGLGPWTGADLSGTAALYAGDGADDEIDPVRRFGRNVARLALRRMRQHLGTMRRDALAIFLLEPSGHAGATIRQPMLGDGGVELCGSIWFVSATAQSGRALLPPSEADGEMFDYIESLGLGNVPAAVFNPQVETPSLRLYSNGLSDEDNFEPFEIAERLVTIAHIRHVIDEMHEKHLCTPDAQSPVASMWADSNKFHTSSKAEYLAQLHVKIELAAKLFDCEIRPEQPTPAGRVDLEVVQRLADGVTIIPAEMEIKVLRERGQSGKKISDKFNENWMRRGIRQAAAYRDVRGARGGILCCFDMRCADPGEAAAFAPVQAFADGLQVVLHRNYLYNDSERWRRARYGT
jgi:hypothetical protein